MRTLRLSHKEIAIIKRALGIAELKFSELRKNYITQVVNVRGIENKSDAIKEVDVFATIEDEFYDLLTSIDNGSKDV